MKTRRFTWSAIISAGAATALVAGAAFAQSPDRREGRWEVYGGGLYLMSESLDFKGGSSLETDDELGFSFGLGYNLSQRLLLTGELDVGSFSGIATWHFMDGPITPYVSATLGWTWVDSNIADGPPQVGCWWDPWYGYICTSLTETKSDTSMSYGFGAVRIEIGGKF